MVPMDRNHQREDPGKSRGPLGRKQIVRAGSERKF
jgi:hypothetical protein